MTDIGAEVDAMYGQWMGRYQGTNTGFTTFDVDDCETHFGGTAYVFEDDPKFPFYIVRFQTNDKNIPASVLTDVGIMDRNTGVAISREEAATKYPDIFLPRQVTIKLTQEENSLKIDWLTDIGTNGNAILPRSQADTPSLIAPEAENDWDSFRSYALGNKAGRFIFRGQTNAYRLRTSFHRTKRKDLIRFLESDIPALHRSLSPRTKHLFKLQDGNDNGAFWNLLQHHGYPTPLLDWSYSPFVAAYFAFQAGPTKRRPDEKVRIFMFDAEAWRSSYRTLQVVGSTQPHFSILDVYPFENDRFIPQQALSVLTNIDDVESYIQFRESQSRRRFLRAFDIPYSQRDKVLNELEMMGITFGALFPGLDGLCADMRTKFFGRDG